MDGHMYTFRRRQVQLFMAISLPSMTNHESKPAMEKQGL